MKRKVIGFLFLLTGAIYFFANLWPHEQIPIHRGERNADVRSNKTFENHLQVENDAHPVDSIPETEQFKEPLSDLQQSIAQGKSEALEDFSQSIPANPSPGLSTALKDPVHYVLIEGHKAHPSHFLVQFKPHLTEKEKLEIARNLNLSLDSDDLFQSDAALLKEIAVSTPSDANPETAGELGRAMQERILALMNTGHFDYVEPDYFLQAHLTPSDTAFTDGRLWGLANTGQDGGQAGVDINAVQAWDITTGVSEIIVAVVDSGIRTTHQDLASQMWLNKDEIAGNGMDDDADGYVDNMHGIDAIHGSGDPIDDNGHGTHVAGTIGASANDEGQHVGVAWNIQLMACRFMDEGGTGLTSDSIKCINFAIANGAAVINASYGSKAFSQAAYDAMARARDAGIIIVASAGNDSSDNDVSPNYPSNFDLDNIISVAAIDRFGQLAGFSNFGTLSVDLAAPGVEISSCGHTGDTAYKRLSGTSMAAPHVSGVAALLKSAYPQYESRDIVERLLKGTVPMPTLAGKTATEGRADAFKALSVTFDGPPVLLTQPGDLTVHELSPGLFTVSADGARPLEFQWYFNDEPIEGANSRSLGFDEVTPENAGIYHVKVTNPAGARTSNAVSLTVLPPLPIRTYAGDLGVSGARDGVKRQARFNQPYGIAVDSDGNVYVADRLNHAIRKITPDREVTTFAGALGQNGYRDGQGGEARFAAPNSLTVDSFNNLYVTEQSNHTIRKITPEGLVTTLTGQPGKPGSQDGPLSAASFDIPEGIVVDASGNLFVADANNHTIRKISTEGRVTTFAGMADQTGLVDGAGNQARFKAPNSLGIDKDDFLYVTDNNNNAVRKISPEGMVTTFAGGSGTSGNTDGMGSSAKFWSPSSTFVGHDGNVYISDTLNNAIRIISPSGEVKTFAGNAKKGTGKADGTWGDPVFHWPKGIAMDLYGNIYVADWLNHAVRIIVPPPESPTILSQPASQIVQSGRDATFSVSATGTGLLSFQWFKDGTDLPGETQSTLRLSPVTDENAGQYSVEVTNHLGSVLSQEAHLQVINHTPPQLAGLSPPNGAVEVFPNATISVTIEDGDTTVVPSSFRLRFDGSDVTDETVITIDSGIFSASYQPPLMEMDTLYSMEFTYEDTSTPPLNFTHRSHFRTLSGGIVIPPSYRTGTGTGLNRGFNIRSAQRPPGGFRLFSVENAEDQLKSVAPYYSTATTSSLINYSLNGKSAGNFNTSNGKADRDFASDKLISSAHSENFCFEITTYLELELGLHRFGVNSDDGFRLTVGPRFDLNTDVILGLWEGGRAAADTMFDFFVAESGLYAFRLVWFQGIGDASVEWFSEDLYTGKRTLINDSTDPGHLPAFRERSQAPDGVDVPYTFITLAGKSATGSDDGPARSAQFHEPNGLAHDDAGNLYVADTLNHTIRKITPEGDVTTLAGFPGQAGGVDGTGKEARFYGPKGLTVDRSGNVYVADTSNHVIRKITPSGEVATVAGKTGSLGSVDGHSTEARFFWPNDIAVDQNGNLFVIEKATHIIRKITPDGYVTTVAGKASASGSADGAGADARFHQPSGIASDLNGNIYVADTANRTVRKITPDFVVSTLAGTPGGFGNLDGVGPAAGFYSINGIEVDQTGNIYVTEGERIRKISPLGEVVTVAGKNDNTGLNNPIGITIDSQLNIFVADTGNHLIKKVSPAFTASIVAGIGNDNVDGFGDQTRFSSPQGIAVGNAGNIFVSDTGNHTIRQIEGNGMVSTIAGIAGVGGKKDGGVDTATFHHPHGIDLFGDDKIYVAQTVFGVLRSVTAKQTVDTIAANLGQPYGMQMDKSGNFFIADFAGHRILKVSPLGSVTAFAGAPGQQGNVDGPPEAATFKFPKDVALDSNGNIFVADSLNYSIRKILPNGEVSTFAGGKLGTKDGFRDLASFRTPAGLTVGKTGILYVADTGNHTIRKITPEGMVSTLAGKPEISGSADGVGSEARFKSPQAIDIDDQGNIYVADTGNSTIRIGIPHFTPPRILLHPEGLTVIEGSATFRVFAISAHPMTYQWKKDGIAIPGETHASLVIEEVAKSDAGTYSVAAINHYGVDTSENAELKVPSPPVIVSQPVSQEVQAGEEVWFEVAVENDEPVAYQWQFMDADIPGATQAILNLDKVTSKNSGPYQVMIRNAMGSVWSDPANLTVHVPPQITIQGQVRFAGELNPVHLKDVSVYLEMGQNRDSRITREDGLFRFPDIPTDMDYTISTGDYSDQPANQGVSTLDILLTRRHILNPLNQELNLKGVQLLAADVNFSNDVTTLDILLMRRLILNPATITSYVDGKPLWIFVPGALDFANPLEPWNHPKKMELKKPEFNFNEADFFGVKLGDVNFSWSPSPIAMAGLGEPGPTLCVGSQWLEPTMDKAFSIPVFSLENLEGLTSVQWSIHWDPTKLHLLNATSDVLQGFSITQHAKVFQELGLLSLSWNDENLNPTKAAMHRPIMNLEYEALEPFDKVMQITLADTPTPIEITKHMVTMPIQTMPGLIVKTDTEMNRRFQFAGGLGEIGPEGNMRLITPTAPGSFYQLLESGTLSPAQWKPVQTRMADGPWMEWRWTASIDHTQSYFKIVAVRPNSRGF